ncbi:MAG TPA: hypothetical protein VKY19_05730 [Ktedonosporobacter sp.]|jgi:hypothetical protein|nr:hypothetical protein [Ktedonosporobacter sp.]
MVEEDPPYSCQLAVILARDAPKGVILRRGPTNWVQLILWHTDSDTFEEGQWFRGRIYEHMSDLSPDGSLFLYLARKAKTLQREQSEYTHKWTAISKPPYFTALALWPVGEAWDGGGIFTDRRTIWLCHHSARAHPRHRPRGLKVSASFEPEAFRQRDRYNRWQLIQEGRFYFEKAAGFPLGAKGITIKPYIWQKDHPDQRYQLVIESYREPNFKTEFLRYVVDTSNDERTLLEDITWVDWDQQGRLVYSKGGQLFASETTEEPLNVRAIADFYTNQPKRVLPPRWATRW